MAAGRDLETLRRDLGRETAANLADFRDPRFTRDGITAWDFGELPEKIDVRRDDRTFAAYPALVDAGESVSLRLADTAAKAEALSRGGLRRLLLLAAWRDVKNQVDWLPNLEKMRLAAAALPGFVVRQHLGELIANRAVPAETPIPRGEAAFAAWTADARQRIAAAVQDVVKLAGPLLEAHHQARFALEQMPAAKWAYALDDMRSNSIALRSRGFSVRRRGSGWSTSLATSARRRSGWSRSAPRRPATGNTPTRLRHAGRSSRSVPKNNVSRGSTTPSWRCSAG